jgi:hypothetical protein
VPIDELHPPVGYSWLWAALGGALILLGIGLVLRILWRTRRRRAPAAPAPANLDEFDAVRAKYAAKLDDLESAYRGGELDGRSLHLALSEAMRGFATRRLGQDTSALTLSEIRQVSGARHLGSLIERYYAPSFADYPPKPGVVDDDDLASIDQARLLVRGW